MTALNSGQLQLLMLQVSTFRGWLYIPLSLSGELRRWWWQTASYIYTSLLHRSLPTLYTHINYYTRAYLRMQDRLDLKAKWPMVCTHSCRTRCCITALTVYTHTLILYMIHAVYIIIHTYTYIHIYSYRMLAINCMSVIACLTHSPPIESFHVLGLKHGTINYIV